MLFRRVTWAQQVNITSTVPISFLMTTANLITIDLSGYICRDKVFIKNYWQPEASRAILDGWYCNPPVMSSRNPCLFRFYSQSDLQWRKRGILNSRRKGLFYMQGSMICNCVDILMFYYKYIEKTARCSLLTMFYWNRLDY